MDASASQEDQTPQHKASLRLQTKGKATKPQPADTLSPTAASQSSSQSVDMDTLAAINFYLVKAQSIWESSSAQSYRTLGVASD